MQEHSSPSAQLTKGRREVVDHILAGSEQHRSPAGDFFPCTESQRS
jgi:hypothetical protein